jgi:hypothetical protein
MSILIKVNVTHRIDVYTMGTRVARALRPSPSFRYQQVIRFTCVIKAAGCKTAL